jgi:hypothetical protein
MRTSRTKTVKRKVVKAKAPKARAKAPKAKATAKPKLRVKAKAKTKTKTTKAKTKTIKVKTKLKTSARPTAAKAKDAKTKPARPPAPRPPLLVKARKRSDDADAFFPDPGEGPARTRDDLAEVLAEDFIGAATSGNDVLEDDLERETSDELGGPFLVTSARVELADDIDESNPVGAEVEAFPRAVADGDAGPSDEPDDSESLDERTH